LGRIKELGDKEEGGVIAGPVVQVDWDRKVVVRDGTDFPFDPREYWILAPAATTWDEECGMVHPLDFGFMLHNARIGKGILPPLATLTDHFTSRSLKVDDALLAEELIEKRRVAEFPEKPSRLDSYFLNTHREVAERRAASWSWQNRKLVRCHLLTTTGTLHCGLVSNYEAVKANPTSEELADLYWEQSPAIVTEDNKHDVELLADCGLYFPDWADFDLLDTPSLVAAQSKYRGIWRQLGRQ
jgi:hypothetical protein